MRQAGLETLARGLSALGVVVALACISPAEARADAGGPWYAGVGIGPHQYFSPFGGCCGVHFRISGEVGWHPSGRDEGFFLGLDLTSTFGGNFWQLQTGLRLGGDIEVFHNSDLAVLLVPAGLVGLGVIDWDNDGPYGTYGYFLLQPSFGVALALVDRLIHVFVRPLAFDFMFLPDHPGGGFRFDAAYFALGGVHFTFG